MISFTSGYYGWLGNQMFQYAATKALSLRADTDCAFPKNKPNLHQVFRLNAKTQASPSPTYIEPYFHYSPIPTNIKSLTLDGYFQSEKYFEDYKDEIRNEFTFRHSKCSAPEINTVSIHVRRGDYLNLSDHHPVCSLDYYKEAMQRFPNHNFLVFSDDKSWCLENFKEDNVKISVNPDPSYDLQLMSLCDHHIIANSSFSWWGAWLGKNKDKEVIAPKEWFGPAKTNHDTKDLCPKEWTVI